MIDPASIKTPHLARWARNENYRSWLTAIIQSPEGELLMRVLEEMSAPIETDDEINTLSMSPDMTQALAAKHLLGSGQRIAMNNIRMLASLGEGQTEDLPHGGWEYAPEEKDTK
jgi:hypothetical protein